MLKKDAKATARSGLQYPQSRFRGILRARNPGGGQISGQMRLKARMSCAKRALLFGLGSAHRTRDRQDPSQRELLRCHTNIIEHRQSQNWSILLLLQDFNWRANEGLRDFNAEAAFGRPRRPSCFDQNWVVPFRMLFHVFGEKGSSVLSVAAGGVSGC